MVSAGGISVLIDNRNENAAEDLFPLAAFFACCFLVLGNKVLETSDGQKSDVRRLLGFFVRRKTAWSLEPGAGSGKRCRLRRRLLKMRRSRHKLAFFGGDLPVDGRQWPRRGRVMATLCEDKAEWRALLSYFFTYCRPSSGASRHLLPEEGLT